MLSLGGGRHFRFCSYYQEGIFYHEKILLIATGGTIASKYTSEGLCPQISSEELLSYVPTARKFYEIDTVQPFSISTAPTLTPPSGWLLRLLSRESTNTMTLRNLPRHGYHGLPRLPPFPISFRTTGNPSSSPAPRSPSTFPSPTPGQSPDSLRFASHDRAHGVNIVFGGEVIAGTRAKKERSKSFNAFSSINFPQIAIIQDSRIIFYIDDKDQSTTPLKFCHTLNDRVFLLKLIPGISGRILEALYDSYDAVIIESFMSAAFQITGTTASMR